MEGGNHGVQVGWEGVSGDVEEEMTPKIVLTEDVVLGDLMWRRK